MAEYIDRKKIKKSYYFQIKGGVFPKSELFVKRDDIFDIPTADVVERENIDKAIEELKHKKSEIACLFDDDWDKGIELVLEIFKRNIGE